MSLRSIKAGFVFAFVIGIVFLALGIYGAYYLFTVEVPSGNISKLPLAVVGCTLFGAIMIVKSYPVFIPLKKNSGMDQAICPSCGALVDENIEACEKCKRPLEKKN